MYECPECGSKDVTSTNRYSAGCGMITLAFVALLVLSVLGSGNAILFFWIMLIVGVVSLGLGVTTGGTILRCNNCDHKWTRG